MKLFKMFFLIIIFLLIVSPVCFARDFGWMEDFNIQAEADPSGFKARLSARFKIGDAEIEAVLNDVKNPADAYMVFRLGEMSNSPAREVVNKFKAGKGQGWGNIARSLGIKPGSEEFHALKNDHDLSGGKSSDKKEGRAKGKSKGKRKK